jgi:hypothetical protein
MTRLATALGLALLVTGAAPAFASSEAPFAGPARPLHIVETDGGNGQSVPAFGAPVARVEGSPAVEIVAEGDSFDVIPLALAGQAGSHG